MDIQTSVSERAYLAGQAQTDAEKMEYHAGRLVAMAGASDAHVLTVTNLVRELSLCLKQTVCRVYSTDRLLYVPACASYFYPDLMILCQPPQLHQRSAGVDALTNPEVIIEVLSDSTRDTDLSRKFRCYQQLSSLRQYVLVEQAEVRIDSYLRQENNDWLLRNFQQKTDAIQIGNCAVSVAEIYDKVL